jgi:NTP pyrophosphatase (non-canonical NTP hydrolase)
MTNEAAKEIYKRALKQYGSSRQVDKTIEELGELSTALMKFKHGEMDMKGVITELADVLIMVYQMSIVFGFDDVVDEIDYKTKRLEQKMLREPQEIAIDYYYGG